MILDVTSQYFHSTFCKLIKLALRTSNASHILSVFLTLIKSFSSL